jgi:hypothetical protein
MVNLRKDGVCSRFIARLCAVLWIVAVGHSAMASDLGLPELNPVTKAGVDVAIGAEMELASRRAVSVIGNAASVVSAIVQQGAGNKVSLAQGGTSNVSSINQQGMFNSASANQQGQSNSLDISQQGNGNSANFSQTGGTRASVLQVGDAHKADIFQTSISPSIVIRQSGAGTVVQTIQY